MEIDNRLYLIYDEVEEIRDGLVIASNIHRNGSTDIDIYNNNEIMYQYKYAEYSVTNDYLMIHDSGVYIIFDIIHIDTLNSLKSSNEYKSKHVIFTMFKREEGVATLITKDEHNEFKTLILSNDMKVLNSDFCTIEDISINGTKCEFKARRKKGDEYKPFKTLKVKMDTQTGNIIKCRHTEILLDAAVTIPLLIAIVIDTVLRKLGRGGISGLRP